MVKRKQLNKADQKFYKANREHKIGIAGFMGHLVLQFIFLADVLDSMYLATKNSGEGRKVLL